MTRRYFSLKIQEEIIDVSVKQKTDYRDIFDRNNEEVREQVTEKILDIIHQSPPLIPTVGQKIPKSWSRFHQFIDAVRMKGLDNKTELVKTMLEKNCVKFIR